jgi:hypothetical protein
VLADVNMNGSTALSLSIFDFGKDLGGDDFDDRPITPAMTPEVPGVNGEANGVDGEVPGVDGESPSDSQFNFPVYIPSLSESSGGPSLIHREP